ncbi:ribosome assembly RNA-binding protein YhbY [Reinekea thalattae]|uniref:Ribosome assembly RNA-binding protein YhbY n=1 Tax=Reinekea thalattae TaxID=2593301 RepID=A0A5C8Z126_9GAMM|nr:ribosome assembly RNA-binding protein YhbY [Reinekea thalattae]TXR51852.1 ribosome assembly RNA-binding protein YhbY [Reinekea thalattae]
MSLKQEQKKRLRTIGHKLNPIVTVGEKGLTDTVMAEINRALDDHELIKVKVVAEDRDDKKAMITALVQQSGAELVQTIGHVALLLKAADEPNPKLSNIIRFSHL